MNKLKKLASFIWMNRRVLGSVIGGTLVLFGYVEEGNFVQQVGEQ